MNWVNIGSENRSSAVRRQAITGTNAELLSIGLLGTNISAIWFIIALRWRHNERDDISNHQPHDCLLNRLFRRRSKKTSKLHVTGLCAGSSPVTGEFPAQRASNAEFFPFDDVIMTNISFKRMHLKNLSAQWRPFNVYSMRLYDACIRRRTVQ